MPHGNASCGNMKETKLCRSCQTEKSTGEFYPIKSGFHSECKACSKARYNEWRRKNRKAHAKRNSDWFRDNREVVLARQRLYMAKLGSDEAKRRRSAEYDRNKPRYSAASKAWKKANRKRATLNESRREARKRSLPNDWTLEEMNAALAHFGNCCPVCGIDLDGRRHWDHWIPLICPTCPGTVKSNMVPLCGRCNMRKNDTLPDVWLKFTFPTTWQQIKERVEQYLNSD
jgi:hypothetical protein